MWRAALDAAQRYGDHEMLVDEHGRRLTYADFVEQATATAGWLTGLGVGAGTPVSWVMPTRVDALLLTLALCRLGAVQNPILPVYGAADLRFVLDQTGCRLLIATATAAGKDLTGVVAEATATLGDVAAQVVDGSLPTDGGATLPDYIAPGEQTRWIFYTSGTTAAPKGARHTDASVLAGGQGLVDGLHLDTADRVGMAFPVAHIGGCACWLGASLRSGCTLLLSEKFEIEENLAYLQREDATIPSTGTVFSVAYLDAARRHPGKLFPRVRVLTSGGAPKPPGLHAAVKAEIGGVGLMSSWGMTESPVSTITGFEDSDEVLDVSEGRANAGVTLCIVGADEQILGPGMEGELRVRGPQVMQGYVDFSLDATAFDADGFLRTGDLARLDTAGNLTITGRLKDIIIRGGENISAAEVELLIRDHPQVADVAVIGVPDPRLGERACAVVVPVDPSDPPTLAAITGLLRDRGLRVFALPERLELVDELPRGATGKVQKHQLRERFR